MTDRHRADKLFGLRYQVFMTGINGYILQTDDLFRAEIRAEQALLTSYQDAWVIDTDTGSVVYRVPQDTDFS